jgi:hypothetical protein
MKEVRKSRESEFRSILEFRSVEKSVEESMKQVKVKRKWNKLQSIRRVPQHSALGQGNLSIGLLTEVIQIASDAKQKT